MSHLKLLDLLAGWAEFVDEQVVGYDIVGIGAAYQEVGGWEGSHAELDARAVEFAKTTLVELIRG